MPIRQGKNSLVSFGPMINESRPKTKTHAHWGGLKLTPLFTNILDYVLFLYEKIQIRGGTPHAKPESEPSISAIIYSKIYV